MSDHWEFYFCKINDRIASVFLDVGLRKNIPDQHKQWFLWVNVRLNDVRDDGMPGPQDSEVLKAIEAALVGSVNAGIGARYVGRISTDGRRSYYFYGESNVGIEDAAARAMTRFPAFVWETGSELDPEWQQYLNGLYPSERDWQRIKNLHVIEQLKRHGDPLSKSRLVSHWLYFPSVAARSAFKTDVIAKGFTVLSDQKSARSDRGEVFGIVLERVDFVDWDSINAVTLELMTLAAMRGGEYDGWETPIVKAT
jgi:hypothetical protein